jgi:hypothetical protein
MEQSINWLSILVAAIIPMVVGFLWYHPKTFGNAWMKGIGMTEEKMKSANMGLTYGLALVLSAVLSFFLLQFNNGAGQEGEFDTFGHGVAHGIVLTLFLVTPILTTKKLFEQSSWTNLFINLGYWAVSLALMGGVVDAMNHWTWT